MLFMVKDSNRLISKFWVHELIPHIHVHEYFCTYYYIKLKRELFKKIKFLFVWKNQIVSFNHAYAKTPCVVLVLQTCCLKKLKMWFKELLAEQIILKKEKENSLNYIKEKSRY